ncbi:MAG: enoyl-CoA hydratase-related protein [Halioglobus sp.]|nr:enoyl-CoA hydratase-related protein [Halioglobus sp.]
MGRLLLNCPEVHNSLGGEQLDIITRYLEAISTDDEVRVLIVTGAGNKTFCAGASLRELGAGQMKEDAFQRMTGLLASTRVPTICALNGNVFGGGVELAASCDFRIGVEGSRMRVPAAAFGLCYPAAGIQRLVECLGVRVTRRVLMAAEEFDSGSMQEIGFLDRLVPAEEFERVVQAFAENIAELGPLAVQAMKRILGQAASGGIDFSTAAELSARCLESTDLQEGLAAQREKRKPRFKNH